VISAARWRTLDREGSLALPPDVTSPMRPDPNGGGTMRAARDILGTRLRAIAALAVAVAMLSTPVQCAMAHGPHSLFVPAEAAAAATAVHLHHHHGDLQTRDLGFVRVPAAGSQPVTVMAASAVSEPALPAALAETAQHAAGRSAVPVPSPAPDAPPAGRADAPPEPPPP